MDPAEGDSVLFTHMVNRAGSNNFSPSRAKGIEQRRSGERKGGRTTNGWGRGGLDRVSMGGLSLPNVGGLPASRSSFSNCGKISKRHGIGPQPSARRQVSAAAAYPPSISRTRASTCNSSNSRPGSASCTSDRISRAVSRSLRWHVWLYIDWFWCEHKSGIDSGHCLLGTPFPAQAGPSAPETLARMEAAALSSGGDFLSWTRRGTLQGSRGRTATGQQAKNTRTSAWPLKLAGATRAQERGNRKCGYTSYQHARPVS